MSRQDYKFYKMVFHPSRREKTKELTSDYLNTLGTLTHDISMYKNQAQGLTKDFPPMPLYRQRYNPCDNPHLYNKHTKPKIKKLNNLVRIYNNRPSDSTIEEVKILYDELYYMFRKKFRYAKELNN